MVEVNIDLGLTAFANARNFHTKEDTPHQKRRKPFKLPRKYDNPFFKRIFNFIASIVTIVKKINYFN